MVFSWWANNLKNFTSWFLGCAAARAARCVVAQEGRRGASAQCSCDIFSSKCQKTRFCVRLVIKNGAFGYKLKNSFQLWLHSSCIRCVKKDGNLSRNSWYMLCFFSFSSFLSCAEFFSRAFLRTLKHPTKVSAWLEWIKSHFFFFFFPPFSFYLWMMG